MARRFLVLISFLSLLALLPLDAQDKTAGPEIVAKLKGHTDAVYAVAFSPDGKFLATASFDNTLKLWDPFTGKEIRTYGGTGGHSKQVISVAFSQDGSMIASGSTDNTLKVWDVPINAPIRSLKTNDSVQAVALSPDGLKLAIGGKDGSLRLVTPTEFKELVKFEAGHQGAITALSFNANGSTLASVGVDRTLRYWDVAKGQLLATVGAHAGSVHNVVVNPNNTAVYTVGDDGLLKFWQLPPPPLPKAFAGHAAPIRALALTADGASFYTGSDDKTVRQFALATAKEVRTLSGPQASVTSVATHPANTFIAAGTADGKIFVWNNADPKTPVQWLAHAGPVTGLQVQATKLMSAGGDGLVKFWGLPLAAPKAQKDPAVVSTLTAHPAGPTFAQFNGAGTQLLTAGADKTVKLWDLAKTSVIKTFGPVADPIKAVTFSKDFTKIGVAAGKNVKVWNVADGKEMVTLSHPAEVLSLTFNTDNTRIATGAADKQTRLWEIAAGKEMQFFPQDDAVAAVLALPNNGYLSAAGKGTRLETSAILRQITVDAGPVQALTIVPANTHVLTGGADKTVKLWNLTSGAKEREFIGATAAVRSLAISKNAQLLAAGGADAVVRVYQFADAKELGSVKLAGEVRALGFTPNSAALVAASAAKTLDAWEVPFTAGQPLAKEFLKPVQRWTTLEALGAFALSADNASIYSGGQDKALHVWKLAAAAPTRSFNYGVNVDAVAFQPKGSLLAAAGHDGKIRFFDLVKNAQAKEISAHISVIQKNNVAEPIYSLEFSPDGKQILSSSFDNSIKLWDVASGKLVKEFKAHKEKEFEKGHQEPVNTAAFSPDGKFIASGSSGLERTIKIWNIDGSVARDLVNPRFKTAPNFPPPAHPGAVTNLRFTKDGKYLISVGDAPGNKGFLAVWDWRTGKMLTGATLPLGVFYGLALSPDEKTLAVTAGNRDRKGASVEFNAAYVLKMPVLGK